MLANSLGETVGLGSTLAIGVAIFPYLQAPGVLVALAIEGVAILAGTLIHEVIVRR